MQFCQSSTTVAIVLTLLCRTECGGELTYHGPGQQFHEFMSSKARPKQRSPSWSSLQELDLGQRLEAKLNAAKQKRLSILSKAQMRLARLDELRQAAKSEVKMRVEKERDELGMKVESRVQQAEAYRMLIQKSRKQRRATRKERTAQSLMRRTMQESKYK